MPSKPAGLAHATASRDALIVGGGLAGASLGIALARQGRSVALVEASARVHDKVCGEFLSYEALGYLQGLGIDARQLGAMPIERVRLVADRVIAEAELPFAAMSVTRRVLDEALLQAAEDAGVRLQRGHRVDSLDKRGDIWVAGMEGGASLRASAAFLATGKHDLHGRPRPAGKQNDLVAFKMYFRLAAAQQAALERYVELILFPGGYAGLQMVQDGAANLCLLVEHSVLKRLGGRWTALLEHLMNASQHLRKRLAGADPLLQKPLALAAIPYGFLWHAAPADGLWRLGDQAAVIPSFAGDGMSIALYSAQLAAATYLGGGTAAAFHDRLHSSLKRSVGIATVLSKLLVTAPVCAHLVRLWPSLLRHVATRTRIAAPHLPWDDGFGRVHVANL